MSMARRCDIWLATDNQFYMLLGNYEYAHDEKDCTAFGPFASEEKAWEELEFHSNPGGGNIDRSGKRPPPTNPEKPSAEKFHNEPPFAAFQWPNASIPR
jgi:hypothetical protein